MSEINFFIEEIDFSFSNKVVVTNWLNQVARNEGRHIDQLNYIFCSDSYLHTINLNYLNHDYFTDIITFDNSEKDGDLEGDIFISIERTKDNALTENVTFDAELHRVILHGLLHLIGYNDKSSDEKVEMKLKEEAYLSLLA